MDVKTDILLPIFVVSERYSGIMGTQEVSYSLIADYYIEHYDEILGYVAKGMQYAC